MARNVRLVARVLADASQFIGTMRAAGLAADSHLLTPLKSKFAYAGVLATAIMGQMAIGVTKEFAKIDRAWADVTTLLPTYTSNATDQMFDHVRDFSLKTGNQLEDSINATYRAVSALFTTPFEQAQLLEASDTLSKAIKIDMNTAVQLIISSLNAFDLEAIETGNVVDALTTAIRFGVTTGDEFAKVMAKTLQPAKALGFGLKEVTAAHAALTNAGISSAEASTYQRRALVEMLRDQNKLNKAFKEFYGTTIREAVREGKSYGDIWGMISEMVDQTGASIFELFGRVQGAQAAVVLLGEKGQEVFNLTMQNYEGAAEAAANKVRDTLQFELDKLSAQWTETKVSLGEGLEVPITFIVKGLTGFLGSADTLFSDPAQFGKELGAALADGLTAAFTFGRSDFALTKSLQEDVRNLNLEYRDAEITLREYMGTVEVFDAEMYKLSAMYQGLNEEQKRHIDKILASDSAIFSMTSAMQMNTASQRESQDAWNTTIRRVELMGGTNRVVGDSFDMLSDYMKDNVFWQNEFNVSIENMGLTMTHSLGGMRTYARQLSELADIQADVVITGMLASRGYDIDKPGGTAGWQLDADTFKTMLLDARAVARSQFNKRGGRGGGRDSKLTDEFEMKAYLYETGQISASEYASWLRQKASGLGGLGTDEGMSLIRQANRLDEDARRESDAANQAMFGKRLADLRFQRSRRGVTDSRTEGRGDDFETMMWFHEQARNLGREYGGDWESELLNPLHRELILLSESIESTRLSLDQEDRDRAASLYTGSFQDQLGALRHDRRLRGIRAGATETDVDDHRVDVWFLNAARTLIDRFRDGLDEETLTPLHRELELLQENIKHFVSKDKGDEQLDVLKDIRDNTDPDNGRPITVEFDPDAVAIRRRSLGWTQRSNVQDGSVLPERVVSGRARF